MLFALGAQLLSAIRGESKKAPFYKQVAYTHGIGLAMIFVAGFGLLSKLSIPFPYPFWIWFKLGAWLFYGFVSAIAFRQPQASKKLWFICIALFFFVIILGKLKIII